MTESTKRGIIALALKMRRKGWTNERMMQVLIVNYPSLGFLALGNILQRYAVSEHGSRSHRCQRVLAFT